MSEGKSASIESAKIALYSAVVVALIGVATTVINSYTNYMSARVQVELPINATQTAEAQKAIMPALTSTQSLLPLEWNVEIMQFGNTVAVSKDNIVEIQRKIFTIRVSSPMPVSVRVNAFDKSTIYQLIVPGYNFKECPIALCDGTGVAVEKGSKRLYVGDDGYENLYYSSSSDNGWSKIAFGKNTIYFDRDIAMLNQQPIERSTYKKLYLVFYVNYHDDQMVNEDEIKNVIVQFK